MNMNQVKGWTKEQIGKAKQQYAKLGDTDFDLLAQGKEQEFLGKVQKTYGKAESETTSAWNDFKKTLNDASDRAA